MPSTVERLPVRREHERVAVLLNANAKSVSERLRRDLENFVPSEDLFYSRTFDDARSIASTVLSRGYRTVLTGGGDGTFVGFANCILDAAAPKGGTAVGRGGTALRLMPEPLPVPRFGVLKLGTGNAVAGLAGASGRRVGVVEDILRARSGEVAGTRHLHLLSVDGKRAPFAGTGLDAKVLNDYCDVKKSLGSGPLKFASHGGLGYFCAVAGKSIPHVIFSRGIPELQVVNLGGPCWQVGPDGRPVGREIAHGEILYKGPARVAAAGTVPYYGFGFTMFPHALKAPGRFQLRLTAIGVPKILGNLRKIWRGGTPSGILDFQCEKVLIRFDRDMPVQIGGDAEGYKREVVVEMSDRSIELLDFRVPAPLRS
jgi:diacylglycerol kinase family enzyme